jgi:hypothetical protein
LHATATAAARLPMRDRDPVGPLLTADALLKSCGDLVVLV